MRHQHQNTRDVTLLEVRVREDPQRTWVTPVGELNLQGSDAFTHELWESQTSSRRVVLDLRALEFIDSAGLHAIVAGRLRATQWRRHLEVICGPGQVRRMLSISGLEPLIKLIEPPLQPQREQQPQRDRRTAA